MSNLKPFNLEAAKAGAAVVTKSGLDVEIIKFDIKKEPYSLCGIVTTVNGDEVVQTYTKEGYVYEGLYNNIDNLFMKPTIHTGWINIYSDGCGATTKNDIYCSYNGAFANRSQNCVDTIKIEWWV